MKQAASFAKLMKFPVHFLPSIISPCTKSRSVASGIASVRMNLPSLHLVPRAVTGKGSALA